VVQRLGGGYPLCRPTGEHLSLFKSPNTGLKALTSPDVQFYTDWWNATGWSQYYRKWNSVVHNFLHRHIFLECKETLHLSTNGAMWATFLLSAIAHEVRPVLYARGLDRTNCYA
jgi:hypothetical protein